MKRNAWGAVIKKNLFPKCKKCHYVHGDNPCKKSHGKKLLIHACALTKKALESSLDRRFAA